MPNVYDKVDAALKRIKQIQNLIKDGLGKPEEKSEAIELAKSTADLFTDDIFKRKVQKLSEVTVWTNVPKGKFVSPKSADQLDGWIALLEEYKEGRKIKSELSSEKVHIQSVVDGEDQHVFITEKGSGEHVHLILDGGTGEIRVDPSDKSPHELVRSVEAKLTLKTGEVVKITKSALSFVEPESPQPDVRAYTASKDDYFVLEIYNSGDEDLEDFQVWADWLQPNGAQRRRLESFAHETDYLVKSMPVSLNTLKKGERIYAIHVPNISVDKKLKVVISCKGMQSGKPLEKTFDLETKNQYE